ncbi:hypothetical protein GGH20_004557 [Coemansia sp. RSA 1937]|nr:hypothetical protein GGH20_004557 [Coemansia sp. RSA 1937]
MVVDEVRRIVTTDVRGFPVVDDVGRVTGYVGCRALARAVADAGIDQNATIAFDQSVHRAGVLQLSALVDSSPVTVRPQTSAETVIEIFRKLGPRVILVTSEDDGQLEGLVTRKDILRHVRSQH